VNTADLFASWNPGRICGVDVIEDHSFSPTIAIRPDCPVSDGFRARMNYWLLCEFGGEYSIPDGQVLMMGGKAVMNPHTLAQVRRELAADFPPIFSR